MFGRPCGILRKPAMMLCLAAVLFGFVPAVHGGWSVEDDRHQR